MNRLLLILLLLLKINLCCFGQDRTIDSLTTLLKNAKHDTIRCLLLSKIIEEELDVNNWKIYNEQLFEITGSNLKSVKNTNTSLVLFYKEHYAEALNNFGVYSDSKGEVANAINYYLKALKIEEEIGNKDGIATAYNNVGIMYKKVGNISKAIESYNKCLKIYEEIGSKEGVATTLVNLGLIHKNLGDVNKAVEYYLKALKFQEQINDKVGMAYSLNNLGVISHNAGNSTKALEYYFKSLVLREEIKDKSGIAASNNQIAAIYFDKGELEKAIEYNQKSLALRKEIQEKKGIATSLNSLGSIYLKSKDLNKAEEYCSQSLMVSKELGYPEDIAKTAMNLKEIYFQKGNYREALEMNELYYQMRDSINNQETRKSSIRSQFKYEYETKMATDSIKSLEEKKIIAAELEHEKTQRYALYGGLALVIVFAFFMFNRFRVTAKQKNIITKQVAEVEYQKHIVEEKNNEIASSINYAKRIQSSFLTSETYIKHFLKEYFILYKPKDVVSGDFYWMHQKGDYFYFCVADSTGHGIPGAFMSLIGIGILNEIVFSKDISETNAILDELRRIVILSVNPEGIADEGKDGMDLVLCRLNLKTRELQYSAANNSFYVCRNNELLEYKPDKMPVGRYGDFEKPFSSHAIQLQQGDIIYASTDGFPDQFGGPKGKKLKYKQLEEFLIASNSIPMERQSEILHQQFINWKGNLEQVDDVTVVGIRV